MRDISTDDLVSTLMLKTEQAERADILYKIHPTAAFAKAKKARVRDRQNALRALNTHLRECLRMMRQPRVARFDYSNIRWPTKISARTVNALKAWKVTQPETMTIQDLLRIPNIGILGVVAIVARSYNSAIHPVNWPELQ